MKLKVPGASMPLPAMSWMPSSSTSTTRRGWLTFAPRLGKPALGVKADQEDFLVLSGEALLIVEGEERPLRQWDLVHCPPGTKHVIVGAGEAPCLVLAVGARDRSTGPDWGGYSVDEAALRHGAGVEQETSDEKQAYSRFPKREPTRYREGWLPE